MKLQKEPIITKEQFMIIVDDIKKAFQAEKDFCDAMDAYTEERNVFLPVGRFFNEVGYKLLAYSLGLDPNDNADDNLLGWYVYETEFGKAPHMNEIIERKPDGTETKYDLSTPDKFYDYLILYLGDKYKTYAHLFDNEGRNGR